VDASGTNLVRLFGDWSSNGNRKGETLCPLLSNICNAFLAAEPFQEDADLVLGGMVLARGAASIADELFGWHWTCHGFVPLL
jgi:hypothetical protein